MEKERDRRFQSATAMQTAVENVASHPAPEPPPKVDAPREPRPVPNPWPRRIFLLIVALIVVPALLIVVGLILPWFARTSPPHLRAHSPSADVVTPERAPFIARLPEGSVELVAVSYYPATNESWWKMDGSPTTPGAFQSPEGDLVPQAGERVFAFVFLAGNLPNGTSLVDWEVANSEGHASAGSLKLKADTGYRLFGQTSLTARLPATLRTTDIRAGFAIGEWTTIFETGAQSVGGVSPTHEGTRWKLGWSPAIETKDGKIVSNWNTPRNRDWQTQVVAVKNDGSIFTATDQSTGQDQTEWRFSGLPKADLKGFRFQVRRVQWVEFRGIKLAPQPLEK